MKIVFICSSIEPGRDGVGDYTRLLSGELIRQGHQVAIIAFDKYVEETQYVTQTDGTSEIVGLRLQFYSKRQAKIKEVKKFIEAFNPEWLSLQLSPFAYHSKGLPLLIYHAFSEIGKKYKWHVMAHELWVGMSKESSLKEKVWGMAQEYLIRFLLFRVKARVIHTQTKLYKHLLDKIGYRAKCLPLFSNIPSIKMQTDKERKQLNSVISFVLFGGIHYGAPVKQFAEEIATFASASGNQVNFIVVGRCGDEGERWVKEWKSTGLDAKLVGEQSASDISDIFYNSSFGIATTPPALIEKSGSVAAMLEHGLPVICVSRRWEPRYDFAIDLPKGIFLYQPGNLGDILSQQVSVEPLATSKSVAKQFLNDLD